MTLRTTTCSDYKELRDVTKLSEVTGLASRSSMSGLALRYFKVPAFDIESSSLSMESSASKPHSLLRQDVDVKMDS